MCGPMVILQRANGAVGMVITVVRIYAYRSSSAISAWYVYSAMILKLPLSRAPLTGRFNLK